LPPRGRVIAQKKGDIDAEVEQSAKALKTLGGRILDVKEISLPELPDKRCLIIIEKTSPIPNSYPRRAGMPAKKPLL
jgi:16S rRNA (guanine527-N7)-methyltransferase